MKVTQERLPASQLGLEIEITSEMSQQAYEKTLRDFTRNANIPGFRKGKVPRQVLIQRFGPSRIKAAVLEELVEDSLKKALEQEKIEALGNFQLKTSFEDLINQFEPGSPLTFSAAVDVPPQLAISEYKGLSVQAEESPYNEKQVDDVLDDYRNRAATLVPVDGRPAQEKDTVVVDFEGRLVGEGDEAGQEIPGGSAQDFEIELTEGRFIPGFIEGIIGMSAGDTKEISVSFPENYVQEDLSGKPAVFSITLKELKTKELPELDDDFAQEVSEFETLAELRASLEKRFKEQADEKTRSNQEAALLAELLKHIEVELPETLIRREVDFLITQTAMQFSRQGLDVKRLFTEEIVQNFRERSRPEAVLRIQRTLTLGKIAELESIEVDAEAVNAKAKEMMESYGDRDVDADRLREVVEEDLLKEKIFDWLFENNTIELVPEGTLAKPEDAADESEADAIAVDADGTIEVAAEAVAESPEAADASAQTADDEDAPKAKGTKRKAKAKAADAEAEES